VSLGCSRVALGHQADDQSETVLFRIVRGTGLRGLAGIPYRRDIFVRPLLDVSRARILAYLRRRSLPFATDPSNVDARYARARLRHSILPALREENPRVDEALRRLAAEAGALSASAADPASRPALAARAAGVHVSSRLGTAMADAARQGGTRSFDAAGGHRLTVSYGRLSIVIPPGGAATSARPAVTGAEGRPSQPVYELERPMTGAGTYRLGPEAAVMVCEGSSPVPTGPAGASASVGGGDALQWTWFDRMQLAWPLVLRVGRPGDRMRPRGGRGSRKLSDLLIDAKVPRPERRGRLVVASADGAILFVPGLRPSAVAAPTAVTRHFVGLAAVCRSTLGPEAEPRAETAVPEAETRAETRAETIVRNGDR
jgi:tRNA(Ile)-lysidine synthase